MIIPPSNTLRGLQGYLPQPLKGLLASCQIRKGVSLVLQAQLTLTSKRFFCKAFRQIRKGVSLVLQAQLRLSSKGFVKFFVKYAKHSVKYVIPSTSLVGFTSKAFF